MTVNGHPGGCSCGPCAAVSGTPGVIANRPGLPEIAYRSGRHGDFLAAMLAGLSRADRPALERLRTRDTDDPTIALLDAFAVTCDVLTFYTERLANESYLGTATERTSLQELGALVAHRLGRGAAAETMLAFSLERPPAPFPLDRRDPGVISPPVPTVLVLPERMRVQSVPGPGETPQTFETVEEIEARPEWNALPVTRTRPYPPVSNRIDAWLAGATLGIAPGDAILFVGSRLDNDRWDVRLVTEVDADQTDARTHVRWESGLGSITPPNPPADAASAFVFRKRLSVFGHNAPVWTTMGRTFQNGYNAQPGHDTSYTGKEWPFFTAATQSNTHVVLDVDGSHGDIVRGSWIAISRDTGGFYRELYRVIDRAELSRSAFAISGKVTRLTLEGEWHDFGSPRDATVYAVAVPLQVIEAPDPTPVQDRSITVDGDATEMVPGRRLMIVGTASGIPDAEVLELEEAIGAGARTTLVFRTAPVAAFDRTTAVVFGNVARATHGETVSQILGSGDARVPFASAAITRLPLTFVLADNPSGTASTLEVRVDDVRWTEVATTVVAGPRDRVYSTRDEPGDRLSVVFGDGVHGARPTTGSNNIRATHRTGIGAAGNVRRDALSMPLDRPLGLKGVTNPIRAEGGVDPETEAHARRSIPVPVLTLGRAVSLSDHADFALAYTGIGKAQASILPLRGGPTVVVSVADDDGLAPPPTVVTRLAAELGRSGDPYVLRAVVPCRSVFFRIALKVKVDPDSERDAVFAAVEASLRSAYSASTRVIGMPVHRSAIIAAAASVVGVIAVDLDLLYRGQTPSLRARLLADPARPGGAVPLGAELLALSPAPFDWLKEMP